MNDLLAPCHFTNIPHDILEIAINKLPSFTGNNAITATNHLIKFTRMLMFCDSPRYNDEDVKMLLFVVSLQGDANNWYYDFPNNYFGSLQAIVNAFKNRYEDQRDSPCTTSAMKNYESVKLWYVLCLE